jgi:ABC-type spermidine/putrescine transport system permease subunit I
MDQQSKPGGGARPGLKGRVIQALGFAVAVVLLGPLNPWIKQKALEEQFGVQDDTWQQALLITVWVLVIGLIYSIVLEFVQQAIRNRKR